MKPPIIALALVVPFAVHQASAQTSLVTAPGLSLVGAAFDEARGRLVIVGGYAPSAANAETWEWDGTSWTKAAVGGPSARNEPLLVYDHARRRIVLYGGDRIVLFGGGTSSGVRYNDTWEFDGARWARVVQDSQPNSPPARGLYGLAYDARRGRVVLTGGFAGFKPGTREPNVLDDTWEWDGTSWRRIEVAGLGPRDHTAMVYDHARGTIVLHAGGRPGIGLLGDTWSYDGSTWTRLADGGPRRGRHRLVYDPRTKAILSYGGWNAEDRQTTELWALIGQVWTRLQPP